MTTTDNAIKSVGDFIASQIPTTILSSVPVHVSGDALTLEPPHITVIDTGAEEHELLRGVLTLSVKVALTTIPGEDEDESTSAANHRAMAAILAAAIEGPQSDYSPLQYRFDGTPDFKCWEVWGMAPTTTADGGRRVTDFPLTLVCQ